MKRHMDSEPMWERFARRLTADGDGAPGGGSPPPAETPAPAPEGGAAPSGDVQPKQLLADAVAPVEVSEGEKPKDAPPETEEQKAERLKNETPDEKVAREAKETADAEKAKADRAEALKPYDALKLPEGMPADQPAVVDFKNQALDLGIEPEKAQKLIDAVAPKLQEAQSAPYRVWADTQEQWIKACETDKEFGGPNFEKNLAVAAMAIDKFGGKPLRDAFAFTGAGSNPEIVRAFFRMGMSLREGVPVEGKSAPAEKPSLGSRMYPSMNPNS